MKRRRKYPLYFKKDNTLRGVFLFFFVLAIGIFGFCGFYFH